MAYVKKENKPQEEFRQEQLPEPLPPKIPIVPSPAGAILESGEFTSPNYKKNSIGWKVDSLGRAEFLDINGPGSANGYFSKASSSVADNVIAHGLGHNPRSIILFAIKDSATDNYAFGHYTNKGTPSNSVCLSLIGGVTTGDTQKAIRIGDTGGTADLVGAVSVDSVNITITWVKTGLPTSTWLLIWYAQ